MRRLWLLASLMLWVGVPAAAEEIPPPAFSTEQIEFFEKRIRPIFVEHCHECHAGDEPEAGLRLTSRENVLQGGDSGPAVVPGELDQGELLLAVSYDPDGYQMPPDGKLPDETIELLRQWVAMGAPWPAGEAATAVDEGFDLAARAERFSFQPLQDVTPPDVENAAWPRTPVDRFLLARLEAAGLAPADETDRRTWIRRAYFDAIGLPPTPEEVQAFLEDEAPGFYERVVDRLLASPHFGERWGRHWLDLVRYAESRGHEFDYDVANPWHYRDYVIRALNDDVPYDQFVVEHVAGDLLASDPTASGGRQPTGETRRLTSPARHVQRIHAETGADESILGTGFWLFGEWVHSPVDIRQEEADRFENMIDVYAKTFLGLTVACARCHDHKFDPITQADYYALQGFLQSSTYQQVRFETAEHNRRIAEQLADLRETAREPLLARFASVVEPTVRSLDKYLLAAEAMRKHSAVDSADSSPSEPGLIETAREFGVNAELLDRWVGYLQSDEAGVGVFGEWIRVTDAGSEETRDDARDDELAPRSQTLDSSTIIVDYNVPGDSFPAGPAFGAAPVQPGDIRLTDDPASPVARIIDYAAAERDPIWDRLRLAGDAMHDPGKIESWRRAGRTLRTPSFQIESGRVFALVKGGCNTYAAVDSHVLINGPLHGDLLREHPHKAEWRWIEHDLSRYAGHRAHLEFVLRGDEPFAVTQVVQAAAPPPDFDPSRLHGVLGDVAAAATPDEAAARYRWAFETALSLMHGDPVHLRWPPANYSGLQNWMIQHPELLVDDVSALQRRMADAAEPFIEQRRRLIKQIRPVSALAPCLLDGSGEDEYVFIRGNWKKPGETVPRRYLEVFSGPELDQPSTINDQSLSGSGRLELALQMVDPEQTPIVPRVIVNRIWQHYFGRGLVATPDDFGHMGEEPSHPDLLDWLARDLIEHDWSLKHIHRQILLSAAYRMDSAVGEPGASAPGLGHVLTESTHPPAHAGGSPAEIDPENTLLHRMNVKRLEGEVIRDAVLAISGRLDERLYGPSVPVHLTPFLEGRGRPAESGPVDGRGRRSLYIAVRRNFAEPLFQAFDFPNPHTTIGLRSVSNVPAQALALMNNPLIVQQSRVWAERLLSETPEASTHQRITRLYEAAFSRPPTEIELAAGAAFVEAQATEYNTSTDDAQVWSDYCHVLVNVKEFVFVQ